MFDTFNGLPLHPLRVGDSGARAAWGDTPASGGGK